MNKNFILLNKSNNLQLNANVVVKFSFEGKEYLVYSIEENEKNNQIFVSKLVLNSEGKWFIDDILLEEKNKLNNIVYTIVILNPTEFQKGVSFESLTNNLFDKFSVKISCDFPDLDIQNYYSNSSIAITSKLLVDTAIKFYSDNLKKEDTINVPTWTAPSEVTSPVPASVDISSNNMNAIVQDVSVPSNLNLQSSQIVEPIVPTEINSNVTGVNSPLNISFQDKNVDNLKSNPQIEKLAIVSDPSLGIGVSQPNIGRTKKAGFANTKYIVIGTICLVLAVAVVVTAYILISNMQ